jgi:hypothetical protein
MPKARTPDELVIREIQRTHNRFEARKAKHHATITKAEQAIAAIDVERNTALDACVDGYLPEKADRLLVAAGVRNDAGIDEVVEPRLIDDDSTEPEL